MNSLQRFERRLEGLVSGAFARAFRSEVKPVEIAAALERELDDTAQVVSRERSMVPNTFAVELSPSDYGRLSPYEDALCVELREIATEHAAGQHYSFPGPVHIGFVEREDLRTGTFHVRSEARAAVEPARPPTDTGIRRAVAMLEIHGQQHPVLAPGLVLGRSSEADLRIDDPGVSRRHAEIRVHGDGPESRLSMVDLGSTNGILVDGQRLAQTDLQDGSRVTLGTTVVTVHRIPGSGGGRV